jgi:hypothetical protein
MGMIYKRGEVPRWEWRKRSDKRKGQPAKELTLSFRTWNQFPAIEWRFLKVGEYQ